MRCAKIEENEKKPLTIPLVCGIINKSPHGRGEEITGEQRRQEKFFEKNRKKDLTKRTDCDIIVKLSEKGSERHLEN